VSRCPPEFESLSPSAPADWDWSPPLVCDAEPDEESRPVEDEVDACGPELSEELELDELDELEDGDGKLGEDGDELELEDDDGKLLLDELDEDDELDDEGAP